MSTQTVDINFPSLWSPRFSLGSLGRGCHKTLLPNDCKNFDGVKLRSSRNVWTPWTTLMPKRATKSKLRNFRRLAQIPGNRSNHEFSLFSQNFQIFRQIWHFRLENLKKPKNPIFPSIPKIPARLGQIPARLGQIPARLGQIPARCAKFPHVSGKFPHVSGKFPHVPVFACFCHFFAFFPRFSRFVFFQCFRGQTSQNWKTPKFGIFSGSKAGFPQNTFLMSANPT